MSFAERENRTSNPPSRPVLCFSTRRSGRPLAIAPMVAIEQLAA